MIIMHLFLSLYSAQLLTPNLAYSHPHQNQKINCNNIYDAVASSVGEVARSSDMFSENIPLYPARLKNRATSAEILSKDSELWSKEWIGQKPDHHLIESWYRSAFLTPAPCREKKFDANIKRALSRYSYKYFNPNYRNGNTHGVFSVSNPVFDKSAGKALIYYSLSDSSEGGRTSLALVAKKGGEWILVGSRIISLS